MRLFIFSGIVTIISVQEGKGIHDEVNLLLFKGPRIEKNHSMSSRTDDFLTVNSFLVKLTKEKRLKSETKIKFTGM